MQRDDLWRNIPGGQDRINDWAHRFAGETDVNVSSTGIHNDMLEATTSASDGFRLSATARRSRSARIRAW